MPWILDSKKSYTSWENKLFDCSQQYINSKRALIIYVFLVDKTYMYKQVFYPHVWWLYHTIKDVWVYRLKQVINNQSSFQPTNSINLSISQSASQASSIQTNY